MPISFDYGSHPKSIWGTWTHTEGTAEETIVVKGNVRGLTLWNLDTGGPYDSNIQWSKSESAGTTTITIHAQADVTSGVFVIYVSQ